MVDFNVFIFVEIIMGMVYAFHMSYRPVFATELNASKSLIGSIIWCGSNISDSLFSCQLFDSNRFHFNHQWYWNDGSSCFYKSYGR